MNEMNMLNEPHWLFIAFVGAIIGIVLPYLSRVASFLFRMLSGNPYLGDWYIYVCCSQRKKPITTKSLISIKNGVSQKYKVKMKDDIINRHFCGTAFVEQNNLCIVFRQTEGGFKETSFHKYEIGIPSNKDVLYGFYLGYDYDLKVSCGCSILSKNQLSDEVLSQYIKNVYNKSSDMPFLNVE